MCYVHCIDECLETFSLLFLNIFIFYNPYEITYVCWYEPNKHWIIIDPLRDWRIFVYKTANAF